uniref:Cytochrome b n=1 Tax=Candidatus Kentrum sp. FW TaxID=2126338 RepID=A0A450TT01_9GAMM|nr:MAG: Cytochrome b [Candidatus Kentron sp. FW]
MTLSRQEISENSEVEWIKLWDPLVRGFHWSLVLLMSSAWLLGHFGPAVMGLHFQCGYAIAGLVLLRLLWGIIGPPSARFSHFIRGPGAIWRYAREFPLRQPSYWPGHSPLGALSVVMMLVLIALQVTTGLISDPDDFINVGPLASWVPPSIRAGAVGWHHLGSWALLALISLHVGVILFYRLWKGEDLVRPMVTGWKFVKPDKSASQ